MDLKSSSQPQILMLSDSRTFKGLEYKGAPLDAQNMKSNYIEEIKEKFQDVTKDTSNKLHLDWLQRSNSLLDGQNK